MLLLLNTYGMRRMEQKLKAHKKDQLYSEAELIISEFAQDYYASRISNQNMLTQLKTTANFIGCRIWIANADGTIIMDTSENDQEINILEYDSTYFDHTFSDNMYFKGVVNKPMLSTVVGIPYNYEIKGYVCLLLPMDSIYDDSVGYLDFMNASYLVFLAVLAVIFCAIYYFAIYPVNRMKHAAREYAQGHFDVKLNLHGNDEYKELGDAIRYMADEIKNLDDYQKKFVANISHDFRSPLTSIRGYAEAIQDGTIPYEMQNKYLDIILFETDRLTKLTTNLLELNSFDNKGTILDLRSFDVNEVIRKTAATFEGYCTKKKIVLNLIFSAKEIFVDADKQKIQQVLYNLIDNAIKFSNTDSSIEVSSEEKGSKVYISIKDHGIGIPKESIKKIWERFYKTDTSRGKDKKGTGLGLSITKEIITAHNENINVISTEGVGTEFIFTLSRSD